jgi:hypothetical protein
MAAVLPGHERADMLLLSKGGSHPSAAARKLLQACFRCVPEFIRLITVDWCHSNHITNAQCPGKQASPLCVYSVLTWLALPRCMCCGHVGVTNTACLRA